MQLPTENGSATGQASEHRIANEPESLQAITLTMALGDIGKRLSTLEIRLDTLSSQVSKPGSLTLELFKVIFGGWSVLGFFFLVLFYSPLRDALNAFPEKVRSANEIGVLGVSFKSTIRVEAARLGESKLSETIPNLSQVSIQYLLQAPPPQHPEGLMSFTLNDQKDEFVAIVFPSQSVIAALSELQEKGLIKILDETNEARGIRGTEIDSYISKIKVSSPGNEEIAPRDGRAIWHLRSPLTPTNTEMPMLRWERTELGDKAVGVILKAVAIELAP
jgi:hypothetical protein